MQSLDFTRFGTLLERSNMDSKLHQSEGVRWCLSRETDNDDTRRGGIMADEMGLGKTIQMLGVIVCNIKKHTLIVLPKALLNQWIKSVNDVFNHEPVLYHGQKIKNLTEEILTKNPIVITTYGMLNKKNNKNNDSLLHSIKWDRIIFDEAHHLRNKKTRKLEGALNMKCANKKCILWFVTGTPIQNRLTDLYSLYKLLGIPKIQYKNPQNHTNLIKKYIIKRTKKEVNINIPKTNEKEIFIDWQSESERDIAEELHTYSATNPQPFSIEKSKFTNPYMKPILPFTMFSKQLCVCPKAFQPHLTNLLKEDKEDFEEPIKNMLVKTGNSKMDTVIKTITERKNNRKKLIFCQFRTEINTIKNALQLHGFTVDVVDGTTSQNKRKEILENQDNPQPRSVAIKHNTSKPSTIVVNDCALSFTERYSVKLERQPSSVTTSTNQDPNYILILQIQVGCEGLNLQSFSEVYFISPNWNPATEDQAIARCHRIGQKQEVDIFRFYMNDFDRHSSSLDTYIKNTQTQKRAIMI